VTPEWNPNSLEPEPSPRTIEGQAIIPPPAAFIPQTPVPIPPFRQSRVGPILFTLGVGLISLNFLLNSYAYYQLTNSPSSISFQSIELAMSLGEIFTAFGVLLASAGWVLDKRATRLVLGSIAQNERKTRQLAGQILVLLGAAAIAGATLFLGVVELEVYYNVTISLPNWTIPFIYAVEGIGVLGIAAGWWIHRSASNVG